MIQQQEYRKSTGVDAIICDAASMSVMVESVGNRSERWQHIKRDEFLRKEEARTGGMRIPRSILRQESRMQHAMSSLSSSSGYTTSNGSGEDEDKRKQILLQTKAALSARETTKKVSSSSTSGASNEQVHPTNNDYHDYHAQPLPDPKLDSGGSAGTGSDPGNDSDNAVVGKHLCTDSSSGDEEKPQQGLKRKCPAPPPLEILAKKTSFASTKTPGMDLRTKEADVPLTNNPAVTDLSLGSNSTNTVRSTLPPNIAGSGGISHNVRPIVGADSNPRLNSAPAIQLPPFLGIGKRPNSLSIASVTSSTSVIPKVIPPKPMNPLLTPRTNPVPQPVPVGDPILPQANKSTVSQQVVNIVGADNDGSSEDSVPPQIQAFYHVKEDDMLLTDDVLMCPFMFRTQDAVICGALSECVMPGMLRAKFSQRNKIINLEMVYDAMGFMQQVGRASGNERVAEIIPNSLEMSLQPNSEDARVITTAKPPYSIVSTNALFTKMTKYTQLEIEKRDLSILEGKRTDPEAKRRPGKPIHDFTNVAKGRAACSTNIYYDKFNVAFVAYVSSYPLTK